MLFVAGLCFSLIQALGQEPVSVRFEDLPRLVRSANGHSQGAEEAALAATERTGFLTRSFLPSFSLFGGGETFRTGPYPFQTQPYGAIEARINVFRGGRDALESVVRDGQRVQAESESQQAYFQELTKARKTFWELVFLRETLGLVRSALEQNDKNAKAAVKRIKGGLATEADRLEFEISEIQLKQDIAKLELESANAERQLSSLVGRPIATRFSTEAFVPHDHDDAIFQEKLDPAEHRDVRSLEGLRAAQDAQKSQALRWWTPSVDIYGTYALYTMRDRDQLAMTDRFDAAIGARVTFELFDGLHSTAEGNAAGRQARAAEARAIQTTRELEASFENAKQGLKLIHTLIHEGERNVEKGQKYLSLTLSEYSRGVKNSPDVLSATQKFLEFRRRYAELRRDYQFARTDLLALVGK